MKKALWLILAFLWVTLGMAPIAHAGVDDFVVNDFYGQYRLHNDVHGGRMEVTESIDLTFSDNNHGILRALPQINRGHSLHLEVKSVSRDGQTEPYSSYTENDNTVLKIGDAGRTITDHHSYQISYEMQNLMDFYDGFDEWYWNINGTQWRQPFTQVRGEVILPDGWKATDRTPSCYTGPQGSTAQNCTLVPTGQGYTFAATHPLGAGENLSVAVPIQKSLFAPTTTGDWVRQNILQLVGIVVGLGGVLYAFNLWRKHGKDYKGRGVIVPEYKPPKGLSPAEVGLLMDYNLDNRDLSATIIDLAIRGYLKVHDEEKKRLGLFTKHVFSLEVVKADTTGLKPHEIDLLGALFKPFQVGTIQDISKIDKTKMYAAVTKIRSKLKSSLTKEHGLLEESPSGAYAKLIGLALVAFMILIFTGAGWGWLIGMLAIILSAILAMILMRRRSHAGVEAYEKVKGLELYMKTAEEDRLKMLQSVDRPYAAPSKTVHLFEKLLPFAIALGVEKSWANQFDHIYSQPPGWYSGNFSTFSTVYFAHSLTQGVSAMNSSFSAPTSSGSSGSGGGGFSGGGGGGGGGGGW
ncbi:MAG TPA: DUF2207 domain-containing protein [Verrucomicrobiae bacterium]|nr:DUF2207 domain-containing protein [Verrucomicrobiae bacterium]